MTQVPTQRIRNLEDRLRAVRALLHETRSQGPRFEGLDISVLLKAFDDISSEPSLPQAKTEDINSSALELDSMMSSLGQFVIDTPWAATFHGPASGFAFVWRTRELFLTQSNDTAAPITQTVMMNLFSSPLPTMDTLETNDAEADIPSSEKMALMLVQSVFGKCHPLIQFLHESDFREMLSRVYVEYPVYSAACRAFLPLLHSVLALGYLFEIPLHCTQGCHATITQA